ncbi:MAG: class I SAM-dependent methyltransferase, partial [Pseudomonadota bacterium]|nr:class I SAM-dependent methyltransferase [Pseudomonadota bacterium]
NLLHLTWHPTERLEALPALAARIRAEGGANIRAPTVLDVSQPIWPLRRVDAVFTANTMHIMSWQEVTDMLRGIGRVLEPGGVLCVYGPFRYAGRYTSDSNRQFDLELQERNHSSGIRDIEAVSSVATQFGLTLQADRDLPAFNRLLVYRKEPPFNR